MTHPSHPRRPQISHSSTLSAIPDSRKRQKTRQTPSGGSFLSSIFGTFTPGHSADSGSGAASSPGLKPHRSEVELRRDYLSPEREKEIGEIWELFKRQSQDKDDGKLTSFPCIVEYEYENDEQDDDETNRRDTRRTIKT